MERLLAAFALLALLAAAPIARAQDLAQPLLLVASPEMAGPYSRTTLVVVPYGDRHIGFIVNRATELTLGRVFPDHAPSAKVVDPVYLGGPEAAGQLFAVVRQNPGGEATMPLFDGLYVTGSAAVIDRIIEQTPNEARYMAGFVGWQPGELAEEIRRGYWFVGKPQAELLFQKDPSGMWKEQLERLGGKPTPPTLEGQVRS